MKKIFLSSFAIIIVGLVHVFAQDIITFTDGSEVNAKVREITLSEVKYVKADNPNGPLYTIARHDIFMIKYENGTRDVFHDFSKTAHKGKGHFDHKAADAKYRSPGLAFLFSALIPGGGQYYNREFLKGGIMTGAWMAGSLIAVASVAGSLDCVDHNGNRFSCDFDEDKAAPGVSFGTTVMFGSWVWSVIDVPIRAAKHNRGLKATGLLEFEKQDKFSLRVDPFNSPGLGGSVTMNF